MNSAGPSRLPRVVVVFGAMLALGVLISVVAVLPGVRTSPGFDPLVDGWIKGATYLLVALLVTARAVLRTASRPAWVWLAGGYTLQALGFVAWLGWVRWQDPVPYPSVADAAWLLSVPAFVVGLLLLMRERWPRRSLTVLLDALAAAAVAAALTVGALTGAVGWAQTIDGPQAAVAFAYPLLDVTRVTVVAAMLAGIGRYGRNATVALLAVSVVGMTAADIVFAVQTAMGTFRPASLLSGLVLAATAVGALAAWVPERDRLPMDRMALSGLRVPALIGAGAIGVLAVGAWLEFSLAATLLATLGLLLLAARVAWTFRAASEVGTLRRAQRVASLGSWVSEPGRLQQDWAEATIALLGMEPSRPKGPDVGDELPDVVVEDDRDVLLAALNAAEQTGRIDVTYQVRRSDDDVRTVRARAEVDLDPKGRPRRWVGTLQDVTEQHQLAAALADSEAMLRRVLTATNDGWWSFDLRTENALASDRWWHLHGYEPPTHPAPGPPWRPVTSPESAALLEAELDHAQAQALPALSVTLITRHREGQDLPVLLRMLLEYDDAGEATRISAAATDLTAARQAETAKDALIAAVSHELRTPLTPIVGFSELLQRGDRLADDQLQAVQAIERNAAHLVALVDGLIAATRAQQRPEQPRPQVLDLTERVRVLLVDRGDEQIDLVAPATAVPGWVDPTHLTQILGNLLDNATRHGEYPIRVHVEHEGAQAAVKVIDHGQGVPDWFMPELFDDFSQPTVGDQRPTLGLGLGLAIAQRLAQANQGALEYQRIEHQTAFCLRLATAPADPDWISTKARSQQPSAHPEAKVRRATPATSDRAQADP